MVNSLGEFYLLLGGDHLLFRDGGQIGFNRLLGTPSNVLSDLDLSHVSLFVMKLRKNIVQI
jgi:hypothetical protein